MNNETKKYLAMLEYRILALENALQGMALGLERGSNISKSCAQCNIFDPHGNNYVCGQKDCCQGLNPSDDDREEVGS